MSVLDVVDAQAQALELMAVVQRIDNEHLVRQHEVAALADGTLALIFDHAAGGSLADVLEARGALAPGETITTIAPLFGALADLHAAGVVHGDPRPGKVVFSDNGRPMVSVVGAVGPGGSFGMPGEPSGFTAPELAAGADPSPASDVYAMAAVGWVCLTGAPPVPEVEAATLTLAPETPFRLVQILASCLSIDPAARPAADQVAADVFDAARAEPVQRGPVSDPAAEITRRIRQAAVPTPKAAPSGREHRPRLSVRAGGGVVALGVLALVVTTALGGGATWVLRHRHLEAQPTAVRLAQPMPTSTPTVSGTRPAKIPVRISEVVSVADSPRLAAAGLLQALADARALAYTARDPGLLDLVYAPGAPKAGVDRSNISTAVRNGASYLGLGFVVKNVAFLDGSSVTARIRATIVTPAYETGQPDGRKVTHQQEVVGPCVFTVKLVPDGWRILSMTVG